MRILEYLVFLSTILFVGCSWKQSPTALEFSEVSEEERVWIEKFFDDFFLNQLTMYPLFGSKPMSDIYVYCKSKEEWFSDYSKIVEKECPKEEQQKAIAEFKEYLNQYDLPGNWEKWMNWKSKHLDQSFLFSKRSTHSDYAFSLYILNVQEAAWILQKYYSTISREFEMEFDPLQVVMEFEDSNSLFWKKVFQSHYVMGILYGFGERNSYFFDRGMRLQDLNSFDLFTHALFKSAIDQTSNAKKFPLPQFRSFSEDMLLDPVYQHYLREKEQISKIIKGKNKYDLILQRLGCQGEAENQEIAFN